MILSAILFKKLDTTPSEKAMLFPLLPVGILFIAIGISLIVIMLATFVVDHFSEERADIYYQHISEAMKLL